MLPLGEVLGLTRDSSSDGVKERKEWNPQRTVKGQLKVVREIPSDKLHSNNRVIKPRINTSSVHGLWRSVCSTDLEQTVKNTKDIKELKY